MKNFQKYRKLILVWLWIGLFMVFIQIVIGGITRLTDSGLSITEWEVVKGVLPPLNEAQWEDAFIKYKTEARKQYESLHADMEMSEFKWIYFWEWFHRLWARTMGIVFIIPFIFFWWKKAIPSHLMKKLIAIVFSAALAGIFGWIMVMSGLGDDTRTWVSAYKLVTHLGIAILTFGIIYWTILSVKFKEDKSGFVQFANKYSRIRLLFIILMIQIIFGGLMAGMRAGLLHPHWPVFVSGESFFNALGNLESFQSDDLLNYEPSVFLKSWVQLIHRVLAYVVAGLVIFYAVCFIPKLQALISSKNNSTYSHIYSQIVSSHWFSVVLVILQLVLGILTVIYSFGSIPVVLGVLHQAVAIILVMSILKLVYLYRPAGN